MKRRRPRIVEMSSGWCGGKRCRFDVPWIVAEVVIDGVSRCDFDRGISALRAVGAAVHDDVSVRLIDPPHEYFISDHDAEGAVDIAAFTGDHIATFARKYLHE